MQIKTILIIIREKNVFKFQTNKGAYASMLPRKRRTFPIVFLKNRNVPKHLANQI